MMNEELKARMEFEEDPDGWLESAERRFEQRITLMQAVLDGSMGPECLTYSDLIVMELRMMDMLRMRYLKQGTHVVLDDYASLYYN